MCAMRSVCTDDKRVEKTIYNMKNELYYEKWIVYTINTE